MPISVRRELDSGQSHWGFWKELLLSVKKILELLYLNTGKSESVYRF
jgi:hypothetical protein